MDIIKQRLDELESYIPGKPIEEVKKEYGLSEVVKLASNEWSLGPFLEASSAINANIDILNRYPDTEAKALRSSLSEKLSISTDNILIGNGSNELIKNMGEAVLCEGDEVVYCSPTFSLFKMMVNFYGATPVELPLKEHTYDLKAMLSVLNDKTKMIIICNPNNPTGTIVKQKELDEFISQACQRKILVIIDEAYNEFVEDADYPETTKYVKNDCPVVTLRTFSKIYGLAGLRIGYGTAPKELVEVDKKIRTPFNVNLMAQIAALESLKNRDELQRRKEINLSNKKRMYSLFEELGLSYVKSEANFILVNAKKDSNEVFKELLKKGVIVRTGDVFGQDYQNYIRVSVGTEEEINAFEKAIKEVI